MHYLNSFFILFPRRGFPDPALLTLRISRSLIFNIPFLNLPTLLAVFNPLSFTFAGFDFLLIGIRIPASCASRSDFSCLLALAASIPLRIRSGTFPFAGSLPPRWDIRASSVKCRNRPGFSFVACSESKFDSRRSRWRAMSCLIFCASSSSEDIVRTG